MEGHDANSRRGARGRTFTTRALPRQMVWLGFAMMCVGMFMAVLDVQVFATSLRTIQQALGIAQDEISWV